MRNIEISIRIIFKDEFFFLVLIEDWFYWVIYWKNEVSVNLLGICGIDVELYWGVEVEVLVY